MRLLFYLPLIVSVFARLILLGFFTQLRSATGKSYNSTTHLDNAQYFIFMSLCTSLPPNSSVFWALTEGLYSTEPGVALADQRFHKNHSFKKFRLGFIQNVVQPNDTAGAFSM